MNSQRIARNSLVGAKDLRNTALKGKAGDMGWGKVVEIPDSSDIRETVEHSR